MTRRTQYNIPTTEGIKTAFGYKIKLWVGQYQEQFFIQEDHLGAPSILCEYSTGSIVKALPCCVTPEPMLTTATRKAAQQWVDNMVSRYKEEGKDFHAALMDKIKNAPLGVLNKD